ncbi:MAG TPA: IS110 family transposase [Caulobacteraceae bacterium]|jgi:transposase
MAHYVGLDVSKLTTQICVIDDEGRIVKEGSVATEPAAIVAYLRGERRRYRRIGLESIGFGSWLYEGIAKAGLPVICIEARQAHSLLKAKLNKTDRNDARGIAEIMRTRAYKAVHIKTRESRDSKLILTARRILIRKLRDIDNIVRSTLLQHGLKIKPGGSATFARRAIQLAQSEQLLTEIVAAFLDVRAVLVDKVALLEGKIEARVRSDAVCRRLMTACGVGALTALSFRAAIDVPERFANSRDVAVHLGLTPRKYESGLISRQKHISKCGDSEARAALFMSAKSVLRPTTRPSELQAWAHHLYESKEYRVAAVAVARRLAVILHRMWITGSDFRWLVEVEGT